MSNTRREFLQTSAAAAASLMGGTNILAQTPKPAQAPAKPALSTPPAGAMDMIQVPTMKFGAMDISRMVLGVNPMYGFAHYNNNFGATMAEWYTQEKVCDVLHRAASLGINAFNYVNIGRAPQDLACFRSQGGKMHLIIQVTAHDDPAALVRDLKPLALQRRG
ncbi:MAG TPA: twin-arginine translocation signal domain-containing protein, partial [Bryobacteraceae bacterium]|nr:twin-arginine translocation signal domain-containing protein [Bryobacteraceae bacterium]